MQTNSDRLRSEPVVKSKREGRDALLPVDKDTNLWYPKGRRIAKNTKKPPQWVAFSGGLEWSGGECTTKLLFLLKMRGKVLCIRVFGSMRFEPVGAASALGEQRHAHAVGTFHLFDHKAADGVEFAVRNGEIEFVVHLQNHFCLQFFLAQ